MQSFIWMNWIQMSLVYHLKDRFMPFHYGYDCHIKYMAGVKSAPHFRDGTLLTLKCLIFIIHNPGMQLGFFWHVCTLTALYWLIPVIQYSCPILKDSIHLFLGETASNLDQISLKMNILTKYDSQVQISIHK